MSDDLSQAILDAFPAPWRAFVLRTNRSVIIAANDHEVMAGINNTKAEFLVRCVNHYVASLSTGNPTAGERDKP